MAPSKPARKQAAPSGQHGGEPSGSPGKTQTTLSKANVTTTVTTTGKLKSVKKATTSKKPARNGVAVPKSSPLKSSPARLDLGSSPISKGTIQSFFNAAPQRRKPSQETMSRTSRASTPLELTETIDSDDDKHSVLSFSKSSNTALALRKRKSSAFGSGVEEAVLPASQKFRRTDTGRMPAMSLTNEDKRPWTVQFAPASLDELAVHKKKIADVRGWLDLALSGRHNRALILKGPAGSGKTTTLKLLAQDLGITTVEWTNPAGRDQVDVSMSSTVQFEEFMMRSGRSSGLRLVENPTESTTAAVPDVDTGQPAAKQLLLVEEFPNTFSKTSPELQSFRSAIAQHLANRGGSQPSIPLVMVISETALSSNTSIADSFTTHRLLGPELSVHPYIDTIEFNPVAPTILHKALEAVIVKEARKSGRRTTPGPAVLKRLTEFGDIRSAISTLEFLCVRGDEEGNWSARIAFGRTKKKAAEAPLTKIENEALLWISSRETTLGIWHAVGKVLYNKRIAPVKKLAAPPQYLLHHQRFMVPENDVNMLVNDIGTDTSTFIAALHENYLPSCTNQGPEQSLDTACKCLEELSDADLLSLDRFSFGSKAYSGSATDTLRQDEMSFQLAVRGVLFVLPPNLKRSLPTSGQRIDAHRMYYPASLRLWRKRDEIESAVDALKVRLKSQMKQIARARVDTAYSLANTDATPWSRKDAIEDTGNDGSYSRGSFITLASKELLMECLPYLNTTLQRLSGDRILMDLLKTVTHMTGQAGIDQSDETAEDGEPSAEPGDGDIKNKMRMSKKMNDSVKAEQQMHSLVLEDDDIVDD